jgi:hypothetical protein
MGEREGGGGESGKQIRGRELNEPEFARWKISSAVNRLEGEAAGVRSGQETVRPVTDLIPNFTGIDRRDLRQGTRNEHTAERDRQRKRDERERETDRGRGREIS